MKIDKGRIINDFIEPNKRQYAEVDSLGRYSLIDSPEDYKVPSIWNSENKENLGWFALSNLKRITISRGDFKSVNGKDLLDSMSGNAYMSYIEI